MKPIIDISYYQRPEALNYDLISNEVGGVIFRAAYGTRADTTFNQHYAEFTKRGIPVGCYHYICEYVTVADQVKVLLAAVKGKTLKLGYWCDVEIEQGADRLTAKTVIDYMTAVESKLGEWGMYVAHWCWKSIMGDEYARYASRKCWMAAYVSDYTKYIPHGWSKPFLWQYTSSGKLNGYGGKLDVNKFMGTEQEYQAWIGAQVSIYPKLKHPLNGEFRISQLFGKNPDWYTISKGHNGIDWATPVGTPVYAMQDGVVIRSLDYSQPGQTDGKTGYGRHVRIQHKEGVSIYGHLSRRDVVEGQKVVAGQQLGLSGGATNDPHSGMSTGPHLHGEYRMDGIKNPVPGGYVYNAIDILPLLEPYQAPGEILPIPEPEPIPVDAKTAVTLVNLNVRKAPGGSIWATAPKGTRFEVLEIQGDWVRVGWNQWCMSKQNGVDYLRFE